VVAGPQCIASWRAAQSRGAADGERLAAALLQAVVPADQVVIAATAAVQPVVQAAAVADAGPPPGHGRRRRPAQGALGRAHGPQAGTDQRPVHETQRGPHGRQQTVERQRQRREQRGGQRPHAGQLQQPGQQSRERGLADAVLGTRFADDIARSSFVREC